MLCLIIIQAVVFKKADDTDINFSGSRLEECVYAALWSKRKRHSVLFMYRHAQVYASLTVADTAGAARDICDAKSVQWFTDTEHEDAWDDSLFPLTISFPIKQKQSLTTSTRI